jgi:hypothetical protein
VVLALLLPRSPSPSTLMLALANSGPAVCVRVCTVSLRVLPDGRSAIVQLTDDAFVVHVAPGRLAEVTAWLRLSESTALRSGCERSELTSTYAMIGEPRATSAALVDMTTAASTPERIDTGTVRVLLEFRRSLVALTRGLGHERGGRTTARDHRHVCARVDSQGA